MNPKLYGDEHGDMSHNEQIYVNSIENAVLREMQDEDNPEDSEDD